MSATILYEFVFTGDYDEAIFMASPYARDSLRIKVQSAVNSEKTFLRRYPSVGNISQQVIDQGQTFKVRLLRAPA